MGVDTYIYDKRIIIDLENNDCQGNHKKFYQKHFDTCKYQQVPYLKPNGRSDYLCEIASIVKYDLENHYYGSENNGDFYNKYSCPRGLYDLVEDLQNSDGAYNVENDYYLIRHT